MKVVYCSDHSFPLPVLPCGIPLLPVGNMFLIAVDLFLWIRFTFPNLTFQAKAVRLIKIYICQEILRTIGAVFNPELFASLVSEITFSPVYNPSMCAEIGSGFIAGFDFKAALFSMEIKCLPGTILI